mmetsp:Transcript_92027/g.168800  ORF Transcript_92027/g.168800 Transcript_92027/m.168800 type:complete len:771 (+) Transcript_92027:150-2462(+)
MAQQAGKRAASNLEIDEYFNHEELALHAYHEGEMVQVLSHTAEGWVEGQVVESVIEGRCTVEFEIPGHGHTLFRKHLLPTSQNLCSLACSTDLVEYDPGCPRRIPKVMAPSALHDFVIGFESDDSDLPVERMQRVNDVFHLEPRGNGAFKASAKLTGGTVSGTFSIAYKPQHRGTDVDVLLKVHALHEDDDDENNLYKPVGTVTKEGLVPHGFVHTLLHKQCEKVHFDPQMGEAQYYLGFTIHENLSTELRDKMRASESKREYIEGLKKRFRETWDKRKDTEGKPLAQDADYIISYTGWDKDDNDKFLKKLTTTLVSGPHAGPGGQRRPITFCTDRSLGFGVHFHQRGGDCDDDQLFTLYLGKHGFAQPLEDGTWWGQYKEAAKRTKYGMLVINPSQQYFESKACKMEWEGIPKERRWLYDAQQNYITRGKLRHLYLVAKLNERFGADGAEKKFDEAQRLVCQRGQETEKHNAMKALEYWNFKEEPKANLAFRSVIHTLKVSAQKRLDPFAIGVLRDSAVRDNGLAFEALTQMMEDDKDDIPGILEALEKVISTYGNKHSGQAIGALERRAKKDREPPKTKEFVSLQNVLSPHIIELAEMNEKSRKRNCAFWALELLAWWGDEKASTAFIPLIKRYSALAEQGDAGAIRALMSCAKNEWEEAIEALKTVLTNGSTSNIETKLMELAEKEKEGKGKKRASGRVEASAKNNAFSESRWIKDMIFTLKDVADKGNQSAKEALRACKESDLLRRKLNEKDDTDAREARTALIQE